MNILPFLLLLTSTSLSFDLLRYSLPAACKSEKDTLTHRIVYTSVEILPECEGGKPALLRKIRKISMTKGESDQEYDGNFVVVSARYPRSARPH